MIKPMVYRTYLLAMLSVILAFNAVDRLALGLLLQEIKIDLGVSDTQLGLLSGIAFALFYSVMGIPIARWADRGNRIAIVSITTALWSAALAASGMAANFVQLLMIRIGVAVGEAGCLPTAHSLIANYFTRAERPRAVARYMMGVPLSVVIGYFVAGWLGEFYGWRVTFVMLGLPGLGLAVLASFTLREPRRGKDAIQNVCAPATSSFLRSDTAALSSAPSMKEVCVTLWANTTFRHLLFCFAVTSFFGYGVVKWQPAFFVRSFGLRTGELGTWFTLIYGLGGFIGTYVGGELAVRRAADNESLQLKAMALAYSVFAILSAFIYLSPSHYLAFGSMGLAVVGAAATSGPLFATIHALVPDRMRALSIAIIYLFANLIGMGLGPLVAGALSDIFQSWAGEESLRYALLSLSPGYLWGGWHFWRASTTVMRDLAAVQLALDSATSSTTPSVSAPIAMPNDAERSALS
jgi:MFS transporter, Spinster family, sphingosine-1-phosphate transporter